MTQRVQRLLNRIPGYTGYQRKESMRDDDRRLRDDIARGLSQASTDLTAMASKMAADRRLDLISVVEETIARIRHLESRVKTASYGYGGLFSDRSIDEHALAQLKSFDVAFQSGVEDLTRLVTKTAVSESVDASSFQEIQQEIADLNRLFDTRGDVIETAVPTQDPDVLSLLEKPRVIGDEAAGMLRLRRGGTISILGDNYQLTGHIALESRNGDQVLTVVQLDQGPEWLAVHDNGTSVDAYRVNESDLPAAPPQGNTASASVSGPQGEQTDIPATYDVEVAGADAPGSARIKVAMAGSYRAYEGKQVPLIDIEVFSKGSTT